VIGCVDTHATPRRASVPCCARWCHRTLASAAATRLTCSSRCSCGRVPALVVVPNSLRLPLSYVTPHDESSLIVLKLLCSIVESSACARPPSGRSPMPQQQRRSPPHHRRCRRRRPIAAHRPQSGARPHQPRPHGPAHHRRHGVVSRRVRAWYDGPWSSLQAEPQHHRVAVCSGCCSRSCSGSRSRRRRRLRLLLSAPLHALRRAQPVSKRG